MSRENFRFRTPSPDKLSRSDLSWSTLSLKSITNDSDVRKPAKAGFIVKYTKRSPVSAPALDPPDTVKRLTAQLTLERKTVEALEERLETQSKNYSQEREKLRGELKVLQEIVQDWKARKQGEIRQELETVTCKLEKCKGHIRVLTSMFVDMLEPLVKPQDQEERESEERLLLMAGIQGALIGKLETTGRETEMDLSGEIGKIKAWGGRFPAFAGGNSTEVTPNLALPRDCPEISIDSPADFSYVKDDLALPPLSYSIDYFTAQSPVEAAAPSLQSTKKIDHLESFSPSSEVYRLKQEILDRIQKRILETEADSKAFQTQAEVLFDFEAQRVRPRQDSDISLVRGEKVVVLEQCESGWWAGRVRGQVGYFPSNYVRLS